jgi:hypothetical protein
VIDVHAAAVVGDPIVVGDGPRDISVSPDGAYVEGVVAVVAVERVLAARAITDGKDKLNGNDSR